MIFLIIELDGSQAPHKERQKHSTFLQDIEEVDEDTSSGGVGYIPPPYGLTLDRQFVEGGLYSVAIKWEPPHPLPEGAVGYSVYVNGEHNSDVNSPEQNTVLLTGIPRKQVRYLPWYKLYRSVAGKVLSSILLTALCAE